MPNATTSVTRICLRCEARIFLRSALSPYHLRATRLFTLPRLISTTSSSSSTRQHGEKSSRLAERPSATHHPLGKLRGRRKRELREETASLDSTSLGKPSKIVLLRDANLEYPKEVSKPDQHAPDEKEKGYTSATELLEAVDAAKTLIGFEQVKTNLEQLRPKSDKAVLSQVECNELAEKVREGFTSTQLGRYMHDLDKSRKLASRRETSQESMRHHSQMSQTEWTLGVTRTLDPSITLSNSGNAHKPSKRDGLVSRLFRDYWNIQIREELESIGELELILPPLEMSLLLGDKRKPLKTICERRRVKLDVFRSKNIIRVTADQEDASSAVSDIRAFLGQLQTLEVDLRPFRVSGSGGKGAANHLTKKGRLKAISHMTGTEIVVQSEGNTLAIYTLGPGLTLAFDARRLLLSQIHPPSQYQEQVFYERGSKTEKADLTYIGPVNDVPWYERGIPWSRLQLPVYRETDGKGSRRYSVVGVNEGPRKFARTIHAFLSNMGDLPAPPQGGLSGPAEEHQSPVEETDTVHIESEEREAKWNSTLESKTVVIAGYTLQESEKPSSRQPAKKEQVQISHRTFSHNIPGLLRCLSSLPPPVTETISPSESLLIHLQPSPWSSPKPPPNSFPSIEILIDIDPVTKTTHPQTVRAILSRRISDLALPDHLADLRFQRRTSITLQNATNSPPINAFLAQSNLDIRSQGRLITPPSMKLKIPRWTIINDDDKATTTTTTTTASEDGGGDDDDREIEMEYLFSSLSHHQTLPLRVDGYEAQYTVVEAGKAGGRRGEFELFLERVPTAEGEEKENEEGEGDQRRPPPPPTPQAEFKTFFDTALAFVRGLRKWT
ncbi:MAG: hypothetical protein M1816_004428 [Peltula sp. TS41687]|nr:MAG: hypothetical protein M1816_004428 [Peltula sp. TS41687]